MTGTGAPKVGPLYFGPIFVGPPPLEAMSTAVNPFQIGVLAEGDNFADRAEELAAVEAALTSPGERVVLFGERRLGKSSVLNRAVANLRTRGHKAILVSLATASSEAEAAQRLVEALRPVLGRSVREFVEDLARSLSITIEVAPDPVTGQMLYRMRFRRDPASEALPNLIGVLDRLNARLDETDEHLGICIDEFQRVVLWGPDSDWALKGATERHRNISYVLAGSEASLIEGMMSDKSSPLWKQVAIIDFGPIDPTLLRGWIWRRMTDTGKDLTRDTADWLVALAYPRTRDVVQLARKVWAATATKIERRDIEAAFEALVEEQSALIERAWAGLKVDSPQQPILRVLASVEHPSTVELLAAATLERFRLGPKSTVASSIDVLVRTEWLTRQGAGSLLFDDPFMRRWVQVNTLPDVGLPVPPLGPQTS